MDGRAHAKAIPYWSIEGLSLMSEASSVIIAGAGGQGVLLAGKLLANAAMKEGRNVTWFPSYGAEMRGGTANCTVVISRGLIGSPIVTLTDALVIMNDASLKNFESRLAPGGILVMDSSNIKSAPERDDIDILRIPVSGILDEAGAARSRNLALLGALIGYNNMIHFETAEESVRELGLKDIAMKALTSGRNYGAHKKSLNN